MKKIIQSKLIFTKEGNLDIIIEKDIEKDTSKIENEKSNKSNKTNKSNKRNDTKEIDKKEVIKVEKPLPLPEDYKPPPELNQYCAPLPIIPNNFDIRSKLVYLDKMINGLVKKAESKGNKNLIIKIMEHYSIFETDDAILLISLFHRNIPNEERYYKRLATEFRLIKKKQFTKVFLQVMDILEISNKLKIPHIIRGSAGSSLICYLLKITDIDPIKECISLARFMHNQRDDLPDIDMDFPSDRRDDIYTEIFKIYGNRVARISNHVKYSQKTALKKAIKDTTGFNKFIPKDFNLTDYTNDETETSKVLDLADNLEGKFKHYSLHCGGIIIFDKPIPKDYILETHTEGNSRIPEVEWQQVSLNKDQVDNCMFIKIDILSNRGLTELWDIDTKDIELYPHDKLVYESLANGENIGIVYAESRAMRKALICLKPNDIQGIACALAIIRPCCREHKSAYFKDYADYKAIKEDIENSKNSVGNNPLGNRPLDDNVKLGDYIIYDDDAIQLIQKLLKCSESNADIYRKAFAKGKKWKMQEFETQLRKNQPLFKEDKVRLIYDQLCNLQAYSFCKSHAISYAKLVYALAYNRVYKPVEFWISALNNCNSSYRKWVYFREAVAIGIVLTRGYPPWIWDDNIRGIVSLSKKTMPIFDMENELSQDEINKLEYFTFGFWCNEKFIADCYLEKDKEPIKKKRKNIVDGNKTIVEEDIWLWRFKGLISNYRCCKTWKKVFTDNTANSNTNKYTMKERNITFCTIGYDNGKYIDILLYGKIGLNKCHIIEGYGIMQDEQNASWIKVEKWKPKYL